MALTFTPFPQEQQICPEFELFSTEGKKISRANVLSSDGPKRPFLIMFICNHCPYVKAIEDRLIQLAKDLAQIEIPVLAICSNDPSENPEDSFENLKARAREKNYPFPYLHDPDQTIALRFGAVCTPDFFLYDGDGYLRYRGRLDDSWKEASRVSRRELYSAAKALLEKRSFEYELVPSMGCSIKWKGQPS